MRPTNGRVAALALLCAVVAGITCLPGCSSPQRTTLLRASDIEVNTQQMVDGLASSPFLSARTADSPKAVLRPERLVNLSDNRLSQGDQWAAMSKVLLSPNMLELLRSKNIVVQMPALKSDAIARAGLTINEPAAEIAPTHIFSGRLRSLTRAGGGDDAGSDRVQRRDTFMFEYSIYEIRSREIMWSGQSEFSRLAHGSLID